MIAPPSLKPHTHHLPYRTTTTILLDDPPYLSLSGNDDVDGGAQAGSLCKGHGENVRCDHCTGGREDGIVINEIGGGDGNVSEIASRVVGNGDDICDSEDEDEDDGEGAEGRDSPASSSSSSSSPMALMPNDTAVAEQGVMLPPRFAPNPVDFTPGVDFFGADRGGSGGAPLSCPLAGNFTVLPPALGGNLFPKVSIFAAAGMGSEDLIMADSCVHVEGCDSGYKSANGDGGICQLAESEANPGKRCCESPESGVGGDDDYEALYQQLKGPVEGICRGWHGWVTPQSFCGELSSPCKSDEMLGNMTDPSGMVVTAQREARGRVKRSGGKNLMGGGQKMGKVRTGGGGGKQALRKRCDGGNAGVFRVS